MDNKEAVRQKVAELVSRFRNTPAKQRDHYNEQQTREYFILPLFRALGWDTENPAEMSAEEQISRGFVDFGFYLNGVVKFYLETKKVSSDLNRPENVKQAINYAWIKGVTWAVLTDFEGLKVLNAEWQDNPDRAVVLDLQYADFAEKGFDDLWLLSKEAMLSGELDRVAEKFHLKIKKLPVNQYLLSNLTNWRKELFAEIRGWDKSLWATDARAVDNAIQRLLDRLIFIRTVEDRGIENRLLQPMIRDTRKGKNLFKDIQQLFRQLDGVYNATLFAEDKIDYLEVHNPGLITKIVNGLYDVGGGTFAFYDFNAIDADVLGAIYEQYLGYKAIDPDAKQAIDFEQEKRRKRKSQGIYYTPQFVVRYIVQNTLGKLLESGVDPYSLRIVDPACGSGSFLIEAFDVLDKWIRTHGSEYDRIHHRIRRLRILRECIYGVDLDEQAVEVARLNLLLRATGERGKLPLLTNIRRGNSLINDPAIAGDAAFDWQTAFPEVFENGGFDVVIGNPPYVRHETLGKAFKDFAQENYVTYAGKADLYTYFIEKGISLLREGGLYGVIVANKWMRANYGLALRKWLKTHRLVNILDFGDIPVFEEATTYPCILVVAHDTPAGNFVAAKMTSESLNDLDKYVVQHGYSIAPQAMTDAAWSLEEGGHYRLLEKIRSQGVPLDAYSSEKVFRGIMTGLNDAFIIDEKIRSTLIRQDKQSERLIRPFFVGRDVREYAPLQAERYLIFMPNGWTHEQSNGAKDGWRWLRSNYRAIADHLSEFETKASQRWDKGEYWWELRPCDYYDKFAAPKIVYPSVAQHGEFTLDEAGNLVDKTCYFIPTGDRYLLGLLNSNTLLYYFSRLGVERRGGYFEYLTQYVKELPIRSISFDDPADKKRHDDMVEMVERMLALKPQYAAADANFDDRRHLLKEQIEQLDAAIDRLVYELYGLTEAEIALVEGR